jgi:DNA-binding MarR family transcriptional regulator
MKYTDCLAYRTLIAVARQRAGLDAPRCAVVFEHLDAAGAVHAPLHEALAEYQLSDLKFAVLVVLFTLDPDPSTPADLAQHTNVSRSAITDALDQLIAQKCIARERDHLDRRSIHIRLTAAGRKLMDRALTHYLRIAGDLARLVDPPAQSALLRGYALLKSGATTLSA